jgi:SAM-dependent methyltransferase
MGYDAEDVKRYYEDNTSRFLRFGQGVDGTIRRAVWGPGVATRRDAMAYVDHLVLEHVQSLAERLGRPPRILDLGCGVGASLFRIAQRCDVVATGVTISPTQVALAQRQIERLHLRESVSIVEADFCRLPAGLDDFDLAFAIESFVHAPEASLFFQGAFDALEPGGTLIVCDDFAVVDPDHLGARERRLLKRYREGWKAHSLPGPSELGRVVGNVGFVGQASRDLTPFVELGRPRDYAIALLTRGLGWLPVRGSYWSMLKGGDALQRCLKRGMVRYRFCVWRKTGATI